MSGGRGFYSEGVSAAHNTMVAVGADKFPGVSAGVLAGYGNDITTVETVPQLLAPLETTSIQAVYPNDLGELLTVVGLGVSTDITTLQITGLSEEYLPQEEIIQMNGTTPVVTTKSWSRVNDFRPVGVPVTETVTLSGVGGVVSYVLAVDQLSQICRFSVAGNSTSQVLSLISTMIKDGGNASAYTVSVLYYRIPALGSIFYRGFLFPSERRSPSVFNNTIPQKIDGVVDYEIRTYADVASVSTFVRSSILLQKVKS